MAADRNLKHEIGVSYEDVCNYKAENLTLLVGVGYFALHLKIQILNNFETIFLCFLPAFPLCSIPSGFQACRAVRKAAILRISVTIPLFRTGGPCTDLPPLARPGLCWAFSLGCF